MTTLCVVISRIVLPSRREIDTQVLFTNTPCTGPTGPETRKSTALCGKVGLAETKVTAKVLDCCPCVGWCCVWAPGSFWRVFLSFEHIRVCRHVRKSFCCQVTLSIPHTLRPSTNKPATHPVESSEGSPYPASIIRQSWTHRLDALCLCAAFSRESVGLWRYFCSDEVWLKNISCS